MRPLVIADSDDESDSNEHLAAAQAVPLPLAQTRSPEQGSLATASTDSVFFQQVYNEQNGAALEKAQQLQRDLDDAPHESSAMTIADVPFQRTTKGFYHSSTTTATDPLMDKPPFSQAADLRAGWPQMTSPEEMHHETQTGAVDPWEVPSSPEVPAALERQLKRQSHKTADQVYTGDEITSTKDVLLDGHRDIEEVAQSRSNKRRRLDKSGGTPSTTDEVSLIMLPTSSRSTLQDGEGTAAASSIPLPTMPLDAGSASYLRRPSLPEREQSSHLDMDFAPTSARKYNNLLLKQQTQYDVGSSGTATNINTQRTQLLSKQNFSSLAPVKPDVEVGTRKAEYRSYGIRRDSSPDIISTLAPVHKKAASEPEHSPDLAPKPSPDQEYRDGRDSSAHQPPPQELQLGENEAEFVAHPTPMVKPKKKRGRPKKPPETDEPLPMKPAAGPVSATADGTPAATAQKKRRGRPKKQSAEVAVDGAPPPAATAVPALVVGSDTRASSGLEKTSASADGDDMIQAAAAQSPQRNSSEKGAAREASSAAEATKCGQDQAAPGSRGGTKDDSASQSSPDKPAEEDVPKEPRQPAARAREEKSGRDKKGSSAQGNAKPLYRVGLSKRFKIAPLLKSVRKP